MMREREDLEGIRYQCQDSAAVSSPLSQHPVGDSGVPQLGNAGAGIGPFLTKPVQNITHASQLMLCPKCSAKNL